MELRTALCDVCGVDLPIVQAPIAASPRLVAAVAEAGGLGVLPLSWLGAAGARDAIREVRRLTDKTFAVNVVLEWPADELVSIALEEGVRIVSFFWGDPSPYLEAVHGAGGVTMLTIATAAGARDAVAAGVDVIVAQGWEAGGHVLGSVATLPLVPAVVDAVAPTPVVAAGGIGDGRGVAAVLVLGAAGAWLGTRFLTTPEASVHALYQEAVTAADETATVHSCVFDVGWPDAPHRTLRNSTVRAWEEAGRPARGRPGEGQPVAWHADGAPIPRYSDVMPEQGMHGDLEALALYAGQSAGIVRDVRPAGEVVRTLAREATAILQRSTKPPDA